MWEDIDFKELTTSDYDYLTLNAEKCVIIFTASWCGPCKMVKPKIPAIAKEYKVTAFWMDIEKNMEITQQHNIQAVPFIMTMRNGTVIDSIATNNVQKITELISKL